MDYISLFGGPAPGNNKQNKGSVAFSATFFTHNSGGACYTVDIQIITTFCCVLLIQETHRNSNQSNGKQILLFIITR
jgi:hypothetical protein